MSYHVCCNNYDFVTIILNVSYIYDFNTAMLKFITKMLSWCVSYMLMTSTLSCYQTFHSSILSAPYVWKSSGNGVSECLPNRVLLEVTVITHSIWILKCNQLKLWALFIHPSYSWSTQRSPPAWLSLQNRSCNSSLRHSKHGSVIMKLWFLDVKKQWLDLISKLPTSFTMLMYSFKTDTLHDTYDYNTYDVYHIYDISSDV